VNIARVRSVVTVVALVAALQTGCGTPHQAGSSLPQTPPMGWNSWNSRIELTEQSVKATIDAMVSSGMRDAGYRYVNLDAGWATPPRGPHGELRTDPVRFPHGIAEVVRYAHDRGMKFGLYASPYNEACSAVPALASAGHETLDAQTFAEWGVDYLKYDWCHNAADHQQQVRMFTTMRDALRATGRPIVYSINPNSSDDHTAGARYDWSGIADMARATADLVPVWHDTLPLLGPLDPFAKGLFLGVPEQFAAADKVVTGSKPGYWTDPDMMVIGVRWTGFVEKMFQRVRKHLAVGDLPPDQIARLRSVADMSDDDVKRVVAAEPNLTDTEQRAQLSLWALLSAPLIAGNDVRTMSPQTRDILTNRDVIAVDQDPKVVPARPLPADSRVLVKPLSDGAVAVGLFNSGDTPVAIATTTAAVGLARSSCYRVRDLWAHAETTTTGALGGGAVPPHEVTLLRVTPYCSTS
jgi:alpha-galactosidase